ncbi:MAG: hypothetical protein AAGI54_02325 [Planctomycetota bacterium]
MPALTPEQQQILEQRGNLSPDEIHKLAAKAKKKLKPHAAAEQSEAAGDDALAGKAACHSDYVDDEEAKRLHKAAGLAGETAQPETVPLGMSAMGIGGKDSVI